MRIRPTSLTHSGVASFFSRHAVTRSGILVGDAPPPSPFPAATDRSFVSAFLLLHHKSKREGGREGGSFLFFPRFYCYCCPSILCSLLTTDWHGGLATDGVHEKKKKEGREGGGEISFLPSHFVPRPLPFEGRRNTSHPSDAAAADADLMITINACDLARLLCLAPDCRSDHSSRRYCRPRWSCSVGVLLPLVL